jgi:transposase
MAELEVIKHRGCVHVIKGSKERELKDGTIKPATQDRQCCKAIEDGDFFCKQHKDNGNLGINYDYLKLSVVRKAIMKNDVDLPEDLYWQKEIPYDTRQLAIKQLIGAYSSSIALKRKGHVKDFDVKFISKKNPHKWFNVDKGALNLKTMTIFKTRLKENAKLIMSKRDVKKLKNLQLIERDITVVCRKPDQWYISFHVINKPDTSVPIFENAFLDPGERQFMTFYSPDGVCGYFGKNYRDEVLLSTLQNHDKLMALSQSKTLRSKTRANLRNKCFKLRTKVKNIVADLHNKTAHWLCNMFQNIFLPDFKVHNMVSKHGHLHSKVVRNMLSLSHNKFRIKMLDFGLRRGRDIVLFDESFTTKVCDICGVINNIGSSKTYSCQNCNHKADRDLHSGRCQCIKVLTQSCS